MPAVCDFMWEHFFPDEPISRSLKITRHWIIDEAHLKDSMKDGCSMAALDKDGNIIGVRLGKRKKRSQWGVKMMENVFDRVLRIITGLIGSRVPIFLNLLVLVDYNVWKMFDQLGCDQIYEDVAVCSARIEGVRGIGTELCRRTDLLAKELGCSHTYACVTGKYSRRIFEKLGFTILSEVAYSDYKDTNGELYLNDTREHMSILTCVKEL